MPVGGPGPQQLRDLSVRLKAMGKEGQGLRRELYRAIDEASKPFARKVTAADYLYPYMPDRYADVLASDMKVTAQKRGGERASVALKAQGRLHRREVQRINAGLLRHPVFARGLRADWAWKSQIAGMRPGFFTDAAREAAPGIRDRVAQACHDVGRKITS